MKKDKKVKVKLTLELEFDANDTDQNDPLYKDNLSLYYYEALQYNLIRRAIHRHVRDRLTYIQQQKDDLAEHENRWLKILENAKVTCDAKIKPTRNRKPV